MTVTKEHVLNIAHLARLNLAEHEVDKYQQHLTKILDLAAQIQQVDTDGITPMSHPLKLTQRSRPDTVTEDNQRQRLLAGAPKTEAGVFLVPTVIE
jgi:aspartyl-tRNA(Asn)/glutamyl-tRNA(Gln) amidotransferase subunit C